MEVFAGEGDDEMATDRVRDGSTGDLRRAFLYGGAGNDKITAPVTMDLRVYGEDGDDKLISSGGVTESLSGGDGNDIIYGGSDMTGTALNTYYGEYTDLFAPRVSNLLERGGNDKIYGGDRNAAEQWFVGGTFDDQIFTGLHNMDTILVWGDNCTSTPLVEDASGLNISDGDDIVDVGNSNLEVKVYGQGGNDKIIGGFGPSQVDRLYGGTGDDKIWLVNPDEREFDT